MVFRARMCARACMCSLAENLPKHRTFPFAVISTGYIHYFRRLMGGLGGLLVNHIVITILDIIHAQRIALVIDKVAGTFHQRYIEPPHDV